MGDKHISEKGFHAASQRRNVVSMDDHLIATKKISRGGAASLRDSLIEHSIIAIINLAKNALRALIRKDAKTQ